MKKITFYFLAFLTMLSVQAQTFTAGDLNYSITSTTSLTVAVTGRSNTATSITIPSTVVYNSKTYSVKSIGVSAFYNNGLTSVTIPNSVTSIGDYAFSNNTALANVNIDKTSPININANVFNGITLANATLEVPAGTQTTYRNASVWKIFGTINDQVGNTFTYQYYTYVVTSNIYKTVEINSVSFASPFLEIPSTVSYNSKTYTVTRIGHNAFYNRNLRSVTIPSTITSIGNSAFGNNGSLIYVIANSTTPIIIDNTNFNTSLTRLSVPAGSKSAYMNAATWKDLSPIDEISFSSGNLNYFITSTINKTVEVISRSKYVTNIVIPETVVYNSITYTVTSITEKAFLFNSLTAITLPNTLTIIGNNSFEGNEITTLIIPNSVVSIGDAAFDNNKISAVTIPNSVTYLGSLAFSYNYLSSIIIPNSLTSIEEYAFYNNQLSSITIPSTVTSIGLNAFESVLTVNNGNVITEKSTPIVINPSVFYGLNLATATLTVPAGAKTAYQNAAVWQNFGTINEVSTLDANSFDSTNNIEVSNTSNTVTITAIGSVLLEKTNIYDASGQTVQTSTQNSIDITTLATGVYFLQIQTNKGILIKKIIK